MPPLYHQEAIQPVQRLPRQRRLMLARMTTTDGQMQDITIRNLSSKGLGGSFSGKSPKVGDRVVILFAHEIAVAGVLRWIKGKAFGMQLDCEINPTVLAVQIAEKKADPAAAENGTWEVSRFYRVHALHTIEADPNRLRRI